MFFSKKIYTLFISRRFIDPGIVTLRREPSFEGQEAIEYDQETFADAIRQVSERFPFKKIRIVLGEDLVYVTDLSFPVGTTITRDLVRQRAEESVPESLRETDWDFKTMRYAKKRETETETVVQVAVVEGVFSRNFHQALERYPLRIESVLPESYVYAILESPCECVAVIVEQGRESVVLCAVEDGLVLATDVRKECSVRDLSDFIVFIADKKEKKIDRIVLSHLDEEHIAALKTFAEERGYECLVKEHNPLIGVALQEKVFGKDEEILNINVFSSVKKRGLWR